MKKFIKQNFKQLLFLRYGFKILKNPKFIIQLIKFNALGKNGAKAKWSNIRPCFNDNTKETNFDTHYIYHPFWASEILKKNNPKIHVDISSTLHFSTLLSVFIPVEFYDYRPANVILPNYKTGHIDLTKMTFEDDSIHSLSCMHTVEHIGLGRYGDPIDPNADIKAINELQRVLAIGGNLLFVVPIGQNIIMFNGQRIYSYNQILNYFDKLSLVEFTLIPDNALEVGMLYNPNISLIDSQNNACGCFWFKKYN